MKLARSSTSVQAALNLAQGQLSARFAVAAGRSIASAPTCSRVVVVREGVHSKGGKEEFLELDLHDRPGAVTTITTEPATTTQTETTDAAIAETNP